MKISRESLKLFFAVSFTLLFLFACGGGGSSSSTQVGTGTLTTSLVDSSTEDYLAIYVTVERVDVHSEGGNWQTVATPDATYNLLELVNGVREELGIKTLDAGHYTQLRMILGDSPDNGLNILNQIHPYANYFIDSSDLEVELKVPSGFNTGIKVVAGFDIADNQTTELILDFDAMKSVVKAANSGQYLLKPTIKVLETVDSAVVTGVVSADADGLGIEGALVSAQNYTNDSAVDAAEQVNVIRSTIAAADDGTTLQDETGEYYLAMPAGSYNLVAYFTGYQPVCETISPTIATPTTVDFSLLDADTGTFTVNVTIANPSVDQHVTIDFRQTGLCTDPATVVSVKSIEIADGGSYDVELPTGSYQVVSSSDGELTQTVTLDVSTGINPSFDISF